MRLGAGGLVNEYLLVCLTTLHFLAANLAVGGPIAALWLQWRGRRGDVAADLYGRRLLRASLHGLYFGALLGIVAAWLWWRGHPVEVERAFRAIPRSRYEFGVAELAFSAICFEAWLAMWRRGRMPRIAWLIGLAGVTNTAYHFPTLFAVLAVLSTRAVPAGETIRFLTLLGDGEVLARTAHFLLASLAAAGALLLMLAAHATDDAGERLKRRAAWLALVPTLLQWPVGIIVLLELPSASREALLGGDVAAASLFGLSLGAVVVLMHKLVGAALARSSLGEIRSVLLWFGLTVALMTAVRQQARKPLYARGTDGGKIVTVAQLH